MLPVFCFNMAEHTNTLWSEMYFSGLNLCKMKHVQKTPNALNISIVLKLSFTILILTELKYTIFPKSFQRADE